MLSLCSLLYPANNSLLLTLSYVSGLNQHEHLPKQSYLSLKYMKGHSQETDEITYSMEKIFENTFETLTPKVMTLEVEALGNT